MEANNQGEHSRMGTKDSNGSKASAPAQGRGHSFGLRCALLCLGASTVFPSHIFAGALDQLSDLTDKAAQAVVTLKDATTSTANTCTM